MSKRLKLRSQIKNPPTNIGVAVNPMAIDTMGALKEDKQIQRLKLIKAIVEARNQNNTARGAGIRRKAGSKGKRRSPVSLVRSAELNVNAGLNQQAVSQKQAAAISYAKQQAGQRRQIARQKIQAYKVQ